MAPALAGGRLSLLADRQFKYLAITPAVLVILLIGLFPIVYSAVVSFQNINMLEEDTSFSGLLNYTRLLHDVRFWQALLHTMLFLLVALPIELVLGLLLAFLFLERIPGRQVFVALLVLPVVISPIIAGAALKGPADRLMVELGLEATVVGVARAYAPVAGVLVIDEADAHLADAVRAEGMRCVVAPTVMHGPAEAAALGQVVLDAGRGVAR